MYGKCPKISHTIVSDKMAYAEIVDPGQAVPEGVRVTWFIIATDKRGYPHNIFSSPEHEVLMVSYCGQSMSVVRRAASTIAL